MIENKKALIYSLENSVNQLENIINQSFKGAYNTQKHSIKLIRFDGFTSGSRFSMRCGFRWGNGNYYFKEI